MYRHLRSAGVRRIFWLGCRTNSHIQYKVPYHGHTHFCASTLIKNVQHTVYLAFNLNCMASIAFDKPRLTHASLFPGSLRTPESTRRSSTVRVSPPRRSQFDLTQSPNSQMPADATQTGPICDRLSIVRCSHRNRI